MIGCEFCVDLGSQICRNNGVSDEELLALARYRHSDLFTEREKMGLDYEVAVMRTPVEVTDESVALDLTSTTSIPCGDRRVRCRAARASRPLRLGRLLSTSEG